MKILLIVAAFGRMSKRMIAKDIGATLVSVALDLQWLRKNYFIMAERHGRSTKWIATAAGKRAVMNEIAG